MEKLFEMLNIGDYVSVSKTENGRLLICVGTRGVMVFDLEYTNCGVIPSDSVIDKNGFAHVRYEHGDWQADTIRAIYRTYTK